MVPVVEEEKTAVRAPRNWIWIPCLALFAMLAAAPEAEAQNRRSFIIKRPGYFNSKQQNSINGPGAARKCAGNLTIAGPASQDGGGGNEINAILSASVVRLAAGGCSPGTVTVTGDSFYVNWASDCVQPGDFVILTFTASGAITPGGVAWQDQFGSTLEAGSFTQTTFPALDPRAALALAGGLALLGLVALRRRRAAPDAN